MLYGGSLGVIGLSQGSSALYFFCVRNKIKLKMALLARPSHSTPRLCGLPHLRCAAGTVVPPPGKRQKAKGKWQYPLDPVTFEVEGPAASIDTTPPEQEDSVNYPQPETWEAGPHFTGAQLGARAHVLAPPSTHPPSPHSALGPTPTLPYTQPPLQPYRHTLSRPLNPTPTATATPYSDTDTLRAGDKDSDEHVENLKKLKETMAELTTAFKTDGKYWGQWADINLGSKWFVSVNRCQGRPDGKSLRPLPKPAQLLLKRARTLLIACGHLPADCGGVGLLWTTETLDQNPHFDSAIKYDSTYVYIEGKKGSRWRPTMI